MYGDGDEPSLQQVYEDEHVQSEEEYKQLLQEVFARPKRYPLESEQRSPKQTQKSSLGKKFYTS